MKQIFMVVFIAITITACNDATKTDKNKMGAGTPVTTTADSSMQMEYAYSIPKPDNWIVGDRNNTKMVLESLKAYENGNLDDCIKYFADTVELYFDGFQAKLPRDSVKAMFQKSRGALNSMQIKMDDWESVKSKDGTEEYVSLWYKQIWQDNKGKTDSIAVMDDLKMKNGKIASLDEKIRHYAPPKK